MIHRLKRRSPSGLISALCIAAGLTAASPAASMTQFFGGGFMSDFTPQCAAEGWSGIRMITARYRPSGLPRNGNVTRLTLLNELGAININTDGRFSNTSQPVRAIAIFSSPWLLENPPTRLRLLPGSSTNLGDSTTLVTLIGELQDFTEIPGCSARFRVYMSRHG